jgi:plasmid stabilization system protein ParE
LHSEACVALATGRRQGRAVEEIRDGYRKLSVGSHFLFYRITGDSVIEVIRILHSGWTFPRICAVESMKALD